MACWRQKYQTKAIGRTAAIQGIYSSHFTNFVRAKARILPPHGLHRLFHACILDNFANDNFRLAPYWPVAQRCQESANIVKALLKERLQEIYY